MRLTHSTTHVELHSVTRSENDTHTQLSIDNRPPTERSANASEHRRNCPWTQRNTDATVHRRNGNRHNCPPQLVHQRNQQSPQSPATNTHCINLHDHPPPPRPPRRNHSPTASYAARPTHEDSAPGTNQAASVSPPSLGQQHHVPTRAATRCVGYNLA